MIRGATTLWRGAGFLMARPALWPLVALPVAVSTAIFALLAWAALRYAPALLDRWLPAPAGWGHLLYWPGVVAAWMLIALLLLLAFYVGSILLAGPLYGRLALRVLGILRGTPVEGPTGFVANVLRPAANTALRLGLVLLLMPLNFVPVAGIIVGPIVASFFLATEFLDFPFDTLKPPVGFSDRQRYLWRHRRDALGFGAMTLVALAIPVVDLVMIPCAVAGAVLFFHERPDGLPSAPRP